MKPKNLKVDRSYHPSKAIREYQDRGLMKWQGFFLSEHTTAMKQWKEEERLPQFSDDMTPQEKMLLLSQSMLNRLDIVLRNLKYHKFDRIRRYDIIRLAK